jgi:hypothetical protein
MMMRWADRLEHWVKVALVLLRTTMVAVTEADAVQ